MKIFPTPFLFHTLHAIIYILGVLGGGNMKYKFSDIKEDSPIILMLHNGSVHLKMDAHIVSIIREDIAVIELHTNLSQVLKFDNITIEVIYTSPDGYPYLWKKAKIVHFKGRYVLQVKGDGIRYNRRCTYRVGVSRNAQLRTPDGREHRIVVKDVSLTGFSVTDRKKELELRKDIGATLVFEDIGHCIDLYGTVIRIEEKEDYTVYGFTIRRSCKDLPSYISTKQRRKRNNLPPSYVI